MDVFRSRGLNACVYKLCAEWMCLGMAAGLRDV